jgi:hypothetical protein
VPSQSGWQQFACFPLAGSSGFRGLRCRAISAISVRGPPYGRVHITRTHQSTAPAHEANTLSSATLSAPGLLVPRSCASLSFCRDMPAGNSARAARPSLESNFKVTPHGQPTACGHGPRITGTFECLDSYVGVGLGIAPTHADSGCHCDKQNRFQNRMQGRFTHPVRFASRPPFGRDMLSVVVVRPAISVGKFL